jgi:hypothetical protein
MPLGTSPDAARKRLERGALLAEKCGSRWRVFLLPGAELDTDVDAAKDATWDVIGRHARQNPGAFGQASR